MTESFPLTKVYIYIYIYIYIYEVKGTAFIEELHLFEGEMMIISIRADEQMRYSHLLPVGRMLI